MVIRFGQMVTFNKDISGFVYKGAMAVIAYIRAGYCYYHMYHKDTGEIYSFPVPLEDMGGATFQAHEKTMTLMRWIRKALEDGTCIRVVPDNS